ncbi:MAG: peptidase dimerization domain-containing protein, partial [Chloroflexi bacterium]|nr:peptidase dimerization domain-containing protein [Chloroflexota bacterium]
AGPSNGCVVKLIRYEGRAAHAGGAPHQGINALKAAMIGLQAIDANRETFKDEDHIRVHPIITKGGDVVNVIPADVRIETYVRGASLEAIESAARKVDRALKAGAMALGATVHIETLPGYMPRLVAQDLVDLYRANVIALAGEEAWGEPRFGAGSTDMGDVSHIMPSMEAQAKGCTGTGHGADYLISDPEVAYIAPAKLAAMTIIDLLANGAAKAQEVLAHYQAPMTKERYLAYMRALAREVTWSAPEE